ncbi:MAG: excinuclease ABC subunit UvrB [Candidatus Omnitrophota bacterium]|nr:MAG: excinuclease ABC subunit UvrB [Candidatus Omnitrophota bacterium]
MEGKFIPRLERIGIFVDQFINQDNASVINSHSTQTILLDNDKINYYAFSLNPRTLQAEIKPISAVHKHHSPKSIWTVTTICGRSVRITGDHNLWVLRNGKLALLKTREVKESDYLPIPLNLPHNTEALDSTMLLDTLDNERRIFVNSDRQSLNLTGQDMWKLGKVIRPESQRSGYQKLRRTVIEGERLSLLDARMLESQGIYLGLPSLKIGLKNSNREIPLEMPITDSLLELIGHYLAEGHAENRYLLISCNETKVQKRLERCFKNLKLSWFVRRNGYDYQVSCSILTRLFKKWCGSNSKVKCLPDFWPQLNQSQLSLLLSAYFTGDGGVEGDDVTVTTASKRLASDLAYALTRFGIYTRMSKRFKRATNSAHKGGLYHRLSISGVNQLRLFTNQINFLSGRKRQQLELIIGKEENTNVDIIPVSGREIKRLRRELCLSQLILARQSGCGRSFISMIESGKRRLSRNLFKRLIKSFEIKTNELKRFDLLKDIFTLKQLSLVFWTRVKSVKQKASDSEWVYDLSVKDNETFYAGFGGLFVHNTFTLANVIEKINKPTLVVSPNKTLCAQLYSEFKEFFPENAVEYFVSYYDYYQPEAYIPQADMYIEKDASINDDIDRLRLSATSSLLSREDVIIVASVSCIYGLGSPEDYKELLLMLQKGDKLTREGLLKKLVEIHYERNDIEFQRAKFRVRGDIIEIFPAYLEIAYRIELDFDKVDTIKEINPLTGKTIREQEKIAIYPAKHFVTTGEKIERAVKSIKKELEEQLARFKSEGKLLEAERLSTRTKYDIEMLRELGYCNGIENYSRHLSGRAPGSRPSCLIDYFPDEFLTIIDESHVTVPQLRGMYNGDRSRKETLVEYGFRLPSALDNRPLTFEEFTGITKEIIFVSATPAKYELSKSGSIIEQVIRPTGLIDPPVVVKPTENQIEDLIKEIKSRVDRKERTLVTTLTKRLAEELAEYLAEMGIAVRYLHSEIDVMERVEILRDLRLRKFDCLVGINLLREGLDLPEVSLVVVLDADKEGFLRSHTSLIQVAGRAARNINGTVIMYADNITESMKRAIEETNRRRKLQIQFNQKHDITPQTIKKAVKESIESYRKAKELIKDVTGEHDDEYELRNVINELEEDMGLAARNLQFEKAMVFRDQIKALKRKLKRP